MRAGTTTVVALAVGACLAAPATAAPAKVRYRQVTAEYEQAGGLTGVIKGTTYVNGDRYGSTTVPTKKGEYAVDVRVVDDAGQPVAFVVGQDWNDDGEADAESVELCGATTSPWRIAKQGAPVVVYILAGTCGDAVSAPTAGTVAARLHSKAPKRR